MSSKLFLIIIVLVNVLLIIRMITGRRGPRPTPLEIGLGTAKAEAAASKEKGGVPARPPPPQSTYHSAKNAGNPQANQGGSPGDWSDGDTGNFENTSVGERSLNCQFMFNGHSFDAYEVLGVPAGSSRDACLRAAVDLRHRRPKEAAFLDALVAAIQSKISS